MSAENGGLPSDEAFRPSTRWRGPSAAELLRWTSSRIHTGVGASIVTAPKSRGERYAKVCTRTRYFRCGKAVGTGTAGPFAKIMRLDMKYRDALYRHPKK